MIELSQHKQDSHSASEIEAAKKAGQVDGGAFVCPDCGKQVTLVLIMVVMVFVCIVCSVTTFAILL